jgi:asparagine synthase (glutamine-hydrolysing)
MCGIGGYIGKSVINSNEKRELMIDSLKHRGPDGYSSFENESGFIVHTRLSIIDTTTNGLQPFSIHNNQIISAHNGEIYNHKRLRESLSSEINYKSNSDSEVIPYYYSEKGIHSVAKEMEGMFAVAILDNKIKKLYLVRDQFGIKPLYYSFKNGELIFGSEIKAILNVNPIFKKNINIQTVYDFLALGYIVEPETFYHDIKCVPAGSILEFDINNGEIKIESYLSNPTTFNSDLGIKEVDTLLKKVIEDQSIADVPMASFLSGGVDSTLVSAYFSKTAEHPKTFCVSFQSEDRDESDIASETAIELNTEHTTIKPFFEVKQDEFDQLIKHFDQPFGDLSMLTTNILCGEVNRKVKVALSGDGGDEFVAGYAKFKLLWILNGIPWKLRTIIKKIANNTPFLPKKFFRVISLLDKSYEEQNFELSSYLRANDLKTFFFESFESPQRHFQWLAGYTTIQNTTINQLKTSLASKMLPKVDRISMLNKLEVRVPLLDQRLTKVLFSMKDSQKLNPFNNKIIYRNLIAKYLPSYKKTKKVGFDFHREELENLGLVNQWINYLKNLDNDSKFWNIVSQNRVNSWVQGYKSKSNLGYSLQSQMQVIFNLYVLAKWFDWNDL